MTELRVLFRIMWRNFASCAAVIVMLAVAIAAATATFAVADAALWRDLPYRESRNVAVLVSRHVNGQNNVSVPDFLAVRNSTVTRVAAAGAFTPDYALTGFGQPRQIRGRVLSADFFATLGVALVAGRDFKRTEEGPGAAYVAILTARLADELFNNQSPLGATVALNGRAYTVVGVLPSYRDPLGDVDIYVPYQFASNLPRHLRLLTPFVRLGDTTINRLRNELSVLSINTADPEAAGYNLDAVPLAEHISGSSRSSVLLLFVAASGLLAIAVLNLTMLIAARIRQRQAEFAIRLALGASRATIRRLASLEVAVLIFCSSVLAVTLSRVLAAILQSRFVGIVNDVTIGPRTLLFVLMVTVLTVAVASIASMTACRAKPRDERRVISSRLSAGRALVISQIAISVLLVLGCVTLAASFLKLRQVQPGFRTTGLLTSRIGLPSALYADPAKKARFWRSLIRDLSQKKMIEAAITTELPLSGEDNPTAFTTRLSDGVAVSTKLRSVSSNYFDVMHIPLLQGRQLSDKDLGDTTEIAIVVNQKLASLLARLGPPLGQVISFDVKEPPIVARVVGVVGDIRHERLSGEPAPEAYTSFEQTPLGTYSLVLDTRWNSRDASAILRTTMDRIDSAQPFTQIVPMSDYIQRNLASSRFDAGLLSFFAFVALLVASTGLYGLLTYLVASTRRDWAIRLALGASPAQLRNRVLQQSVADAASGLLAGGAIFLLGSRWFQGMYYGVSPANPWLIATCVVVVSTTCVLSATMPAIRAARVSPREAFE
jgi:putative ABC transport system permease protein